MCERSAKGPLRKLLRQLHLPTVVCHDLEEALRQIAKQPVEVAVVAMEQDEECLGLLQLLRRALQKTPIVLVLEDPTPAARLATLTVRPFYVAVPPVGAEEMAAVLRDALAASRRKK